MPRRLSAPLADMAQRGHSVCLLERGREIWPGAYPDGLLSALGDVQLDTPERHLFSHTGMFVFFQALDRLVNYLSQAVGQTGA
jgi:choline dehydrogenase-like flavoprotein